MVEGSVSAYLSFEQSSECFNLGFAVVPGVMNEVGSLVESKRSRGSTV